jgi:hypothetical protein
MENCKCGICLSRAAWEDESTDFNEDEAIDFEFTMDEQSSWYKPPYKPEPDWPGGWVTVA